MTPLKFHRPPEEVGAIIQKLREDEAHLAGLTIEEHIKMKPLTALIDPHDIFGFTTEEDV